MRPGRVSTPVPATHCQLPRFEATSPSSSSASKCAAPSRQSIAEVLGQERGDEQPRAVVHEPGRRQLAHAGVDDRDSRSGPPSTRRGRRGRRATRGGAGAGRCVALAGYGGEELRVEVAPRELADELVAAAARRHLERREQAEVQRDRQPRGRVGREVVAHLGVAARRRPRASASSCCARRGLAAVAGRRPAGRRARRRRAARAARGAILERAPRLGRPGAVVRREDAVVVAVGRRDRARRHDGDAREAPAPRAPRAAAARAAARRARRPRRGTRPRRRTRAPRAPSPPRARRAGRRARRRAGAASASRSCSAAASSADAPLATRASSVSSSTNSGSTRSASRAAAASAGLSWTRRSRVKRTTAQRISGATRGPRRRGAAPRGGSRGASAARPRSSAPAVSSCRPAPWPTSRCSGAKRSSAAGGRSSRSTGLTPTGCPGAQ